MGVGRRQGPEQGPEKAGKEVQAGPRADGDQLPEGLPDAPLRPAGRLSALHVRPAWPQGA